MAMGEALVGVQLLAVEEASASASAAVSARCLRSASDIYNDVVFKTDTLYNTQAPPPWVAFLIGGICSVIGVIMFFRRLLLLQKTLKIELRGSTLIRAMITIGIDSNEPVYTISSFAGASFLFLGGLQLNYQVTFGFMILMYVFTSAGDSMHVILAFYGATSLKDLVITSDVIRAQLRSVTAELKPANLYEDLGRGWLIVCMVFFTQIILIAFVVADVFGGSTHTCPDGSSNCPVVGTLGSWGLYGLGVFMAVVYLLGPKSNFGQSEQNPSYWLHLLLAAKQTGAMYSWYDPVTDKTFTQRLSRNHWTLWLRFFMSFLINGVGFHILVHALPLQVAGQSTLIGVVFRAVGMMYLVDLDDTPGYILTLVENEVQPDKISNEKLHEEAIVDSHSLGAIDGDESPDTSPQPTDFGPSSDTTHLSGNHSSNTVPLLLSDEADRIIDEAIQTTIAKLEALKSGKLPSSPAITTGILKFGQDQSTMIFATRAGSALAPHASIRSVTMNTMGTSTQKIVLSGQELSPGIQSQELSIRPNRAELSTQHHAPEISIRPVAPELPIHSGYTPELSIREDIRSVLAVKPSVGARVAKASQTLLLVGASKRTFQKPSALADSKSSSVDGQAVVTTRGNLIDAQGHDGQMKDCTSTNPDIEVGDSNTLHHKGELSVND